MSEQAEQFESETRVRCPQCGVAMSPSYQAYDGEYQVCVNCHKEFPVERRSIWISPPLEEACPPGSTQD